MNTTDGEFNINNAGNGLLYNCTISGSINCNAKPISGEDILLGLWLNTLIGLLCICGFILWRPRFRVYFNRLVMPQLAEEQRPPPMELRGHHRIWSWLVPVWQVGDEELLRMVGLDALVAQRTVGFGVALLLPIMVASIGILLPINYTSFDTRAVAQATNDTLTTTFMRLTISSIPSGSPLLWVSFVFVYIFMGWGCFLLIQYSREWVALRYMHDKHLSQGTLPSSPSSRHELSAAVAALASASARALAAGGTAKEAGGVLQPMQLASGAAHATNGAAAAAAGSGLKQQLGHELHSHALGSQALGSPFAAPSEGESAPVPTAQPSSATEGSEIGVPVRASTHQDKEAQVQLEELCPLFNPIELFTAGRYTVLVQDATPETFELKPPQVEANTLVRFIPAHIRALPHNGTAMLQGQLKKLSKSRPGVKKATLVAIAQRKRCMQEAENMFRLLFPRDFDGVIPMYDFSAADKVVSKWDVQRRRLDRLQVQEDKDQQQRRKQSAAAAGAGCSSTSTSTLGRLAAAWARWSGERAERQRAKRVEGITDAERQLAKLQQELADAQAEAKKVPAPSFFVTFKSQQAAAFASQLNVQPDQERMMHVMKAPAPNDTNHVALLRSSWSRGIRPMIVLLPVWLQILLPIGGLVGALSTFTSSLCSPLRGKLTDTWFCSDDGLPTFLRSLISGFLPSVLLSVYQALVLPLWFYLCAQGEGHVSFTSLNCRMAHWFFLHDLLNVFLGAMLGGSAASSAQAIIESPRQFLNVLGTAVPASSNFFINYVMYRALAMTGFRLFYPNAGGVFPNILRWLHLMPWPQTARDKEVDCPPRNARYSRDIGVTLLTVYVMVLSYAIVAPLIVPFGLLFFLLLYPVWRYQFLYTWQGSYDMGGEMFPYFANRILCCLGAMVVFTSAIIAVKGGYIPAILLIFTGVYFLVWFSRWLEEHYGKVVRQPLAAALHTAPRIHVQPQLYTPPPLRRDAAGYFPEWGKAWIGWGIPRYGF